MPRRGLRWHVVSEPPQRLATKGCLKGGARAATHGLPGIGSNVSHQVLLRCGQSCRQRAPPLHGTSPCAGGGNVRPSADRASANQAGLMHGEERVVPPLVQELAVEACRLPAAQLSEQDRIELVHHGSYLPSGTRSARPGGGQGCAVGRSGGCGSHRDLSLVGIEPPWFNGANRRQQEWADETGRRILGATNRALDAGNSNNRFRAWQLARKSLALIRPEFRIGKSYSMENGPWTR